MKLSGTRRLAVCSMLLLLGAFALAGPAGSGYHLLKKYSFGAAVGSTNEYFDYLTVDSAARRVYLSHGTEVKVLDADNGAVVGNMTGFKQNHAIVIVDEVGRGFISDGGQGKVIIFDPKTLKVTGEAKADNDADCVLYDPVSKRVFVMNGHSHNATVIDAKSGDVVGRIDMGGAPEFEVTDGKGTVYDNIEDTGEIVAIDSRTLKIKSRWPVAPAGTPTALAMDVEHRRLFISGRNPQMLVVMDADSGKVIQFLPITAGADANIYEPETGLLFASTREGMIHVFHEDTPDKFSVVDTVKTEYGAKTLALDTKTHNLFLPTADFGAPPAPTAAQPHPNPAAIPGTFRLLIYGP